MAVTHTPGPWLSRIPSGIHLVGPLGNDISALIIDDAEKERDIAYVIAQDPRNEGIAYKDNKAIANAHLIGAAPELLEALTALGVMPDGYCFCQQNRDPLKIEKEHTGECRVARAAIAKAELS